VFSGLSGGSTNVVSARLNSAAIACICSVDSAVPSATTASGLPPNCRSVNTSMVTNSTCKSFTSLLPSQTSMSAARRASERKHLPGSSLDPLTRWTHGAKLVSESLIDLEQLCRVCVSRRDLPNNLCCLGPGLIRRGERGRPDWCWDRCWLFGATLEQILRDELEYGVSDRGAEEAALFIGHFNKPTCPAPQVAAALGIGQVAHGRQCVIAGG